MINSYPLLLSIGFVLYYTWLHLFSDFVRSGMVTNTPNIHVSILRTQYRVTIKTFNKNDNLLGFAWFKSIFLNESLFRDKRRLMLTFHHEYYHFKHKHKLWIIVMRYIFASSPLLLYFIWWPMFLIIFLGLSLGIHYITENFETKANKYAQDQVASKAH